MKTKGEKGRQLVRLTVRRIYVATLNLKIKIKDKERFHQTNNYISLFLHDAQSKLLIMKLKRPAS